ncbi:hypothetical protein Lal_00012376, partial [Lupinus albus]
IRGTISLGYLETRVQNLRTTIYKKIFQLIKANNEGRIHTILHFSTNIIYFVILSGYSIVEFLNNLSDTINAFLILLLSDLHIGFHSIHGWELMIGSIYKYLFFGESWIGNYATDLPNFIVEIFRINNWTMQTRNAFTSIKEEIIRSISISQMIYIITRAPISNAYPILHL